MSRSMTARVSRDRAGSGVHLKNLSKKEERGSEREIIELKVVVFFYLHQRRAHKNLRVHACGTSGTQAHLFVISQQVRGGLDKGSLTPSLFLTLHLSPPLSPKAFDSRALSVFHSRAEECRTQNAPHHFPSLLTPHCVSARWRLSPGGLVTGSTPGQKRVQRGPRKRVWSGRQMFETRGRCPQTHRGGRQAQQWWDSFQEDATWVSASSCFSARESRPR